MAYSSDSYDELITIPDFYDDDDSKIISSIPWIPYEDLGVATNNWSESNLLRKGGFVQMFKGEWKQLPVAVRHLNLLQDDYCRNVHLIREIRLMDKYRHDNILPLFGYSRRGPVACQVYQLMAEGSLEQRLKAKTHHSLLTWSQRHNIAHGVARGLQFLHTMAGRPLIHGNIKPSNILLDQCLMPKIGDFGLASTWQKWCVYGSRLYLPEEYLRDRSKLSPLVDVFSYGVVLIEIATALLAFDLNRPQKQLLLSVYVHDLNKIGIDPATLEDPAIRQTEHSNPEMCRAFFSLGIHCTKYRPERPTMLHVSKRLDEIREKSVCCNKST